MNHPITPFLFVLHSVPVGAEPTSPGCRAPGGLERVRSSLRSGRRKTDIPRMSCALSHTCDEFGIGFEQGSTLRYFLFSWEAARP